MFLRVFSIADRETALQQLSELQVAPSVGLHDVPRESVGQHLGLMADEETLSKDELDDKLARKLSLVVGNSLSVLTFFRARSLRVSVAGSGYSRTRLRRVRRLRFPSI